MHPTVPARTSKSKMGPSPPMKRNTGPSGLCQNASFTKNLWKKERQTEKREEKNRKNEMFYSGPTKPTAHS